MASMRQIEKDLSNLQADISKLVRHLRGNGAEKVGEWSGQLQQVRDEGTTQLRAKVDQLQGQVRALQSVVREQRDRAEKAVHDHPFLAVTAAFGLGMAVGKLVDMGMKRAA